MKIRSLELLSAKAKYFRIIVLALLLLGFGNGCISMMTTASTFTPSFTPTDRQPTVPQAWKTFNHGDYTLNYPSTYYTASNDPVILIADTETTYDSWMHSGSINNNGFLIQLVSLNLDRRLDPNRDPSPLVTPEQALQREINRTVGVCYDVSGSTDVSWENANGETYDGRKVFCPSVSYQNTSLGPTSAAKVISDNAVLYFMLVPNDDDIYVRITVQPSSSVLIKVADQILSTFTFTR
jgi:hypothetical protein